MSFINPKTKEINCKIVYYGPPFSGKTTNLRQIHKKVASNKKKKLMSVTEQEDRTLFFDFLPLTLGKVKGYTVRLHLYTLPGQPELEASRKVILKGVDGVVFVADSQIDKLESNIESWKGLNTHLRGLDIDLKSTPTVIQLNKRDLKEILPAQEFGEVFKGHTCLESVATKGEGVIESLQAVAKLVLKDLKKS
jgi:mutual gliding-motility protein MglA